MRTFAASKVLAALPGTLAPDAVYAVRVGAGFDLYITDSTGNVAYKINAASPGAINEQTGTTYTLAIGDVVNGVRCTNAAPIALSIDSHANVALPRYARIPLRQGGAGAITVGIVAESGVTLRTKNGAATTGQGDGRVLEQVDIDTWILW